MGDLDIEDIDVAAVDAVVFCGGLTWLMGTVFPDFPNIR